MEEKPDALGLGHGPYPLFREGAGGSQQGQETWDGAGEHHDSFVSYWAQVGDRASCSLGFQKVKPVVRG